MNLLRSAPQRPVPTGRLFAAIVILWAAPMVAGWMIATLLPMVTPLFAPGTLLAVYLGVQMLIFSPFFSWIGWLIVLPLAWFLLRDGYFGWASAAATGLLAGGLAAPIADLPVAPLLGLPAGIGLRWLLGRSLPLA